MKYAVFTHTIDNKKTKVRNSIITLIFLAVGLSASAQHLTPPKTYWQSFGYQKQPDHVQTVHYKSDSLGYEPTTVLVKSFNKEGFIIQDYIEVLGNFASKTAHNYVYKNGVLDSINTLTTNKNFNSTQKLHYDAKGKLSKIISYGTYTNYAVHFTYDHNGLVQTIQRKYADEQSTLTATFNHQKNYVTEVDALKNGEKKTRYFVYEGDDLFAMISGKSIYTIRFYNNFHRYNFEIEVEKDALQYALDKRKLYQQDEKYLGKLLEEKNGKIVYDIPAETKNENKDVIRQLELDKLYKTTKRRLIFSKYVYADGTTSGSTEMDLIFESKVRKMK